MPLWTPAQPDEAARNPAVIRQRVFGQHLGADAAFELIDRGLEISVLDNFLKLFPGAGPEISTILHVSERSLARRRSQGRFTPAESDRLFRLVEMYSLASCVLGSAEAADELMRSPAAAFGDRAPLEYMRNEAGAQRVSTLLQRIEHSVCS